MTDPQYLYYAALAVVFLSIPFNRVAGIVLGVWVFENVPYHLDIPVQFGDAIGDFVGLVFALTYAFNAPQPANRFAAVLFLPMLVIDVVRIKGYVSPGGHYWVSFGLAMAQVLAIPVGNDWQHVRKTWVCYRRAKPRDWLYITLARRHAL